MSSIVSNNEEPSEIQKFYTGCNIFITGGSGFLGNLLIQKLIRDCPDLSKIYLLMRPNKKFATSKERFDNMLQDIVFEKMKNEQPNYAAKLELVTGDLGRPDLGLSEDDKIILSKEVNIIFHIAATVNLLEKIKKAAAINIKATRDVINLAKTMTNLKAFVYCSTAFSNCVHKKIDEILYDMPHSPRKILEITDVLDDDDLKVLTPRLLGDWPNTYTFTKCLAEKLIKEEGQGLPIAIAVFVIGLKKLLGDWPNTYTFTKCLAEKLIKEEGQGLPIAIIRPSMVISTVSDPLEGWINNVYGPIGMSVGVGIGIVRVARADSNLNCDIVPADYVINNTIAAAYFTGTTDNDGNIGNNVYSDSHMKTSNKMTIFNYVSSSENPFTWEDLRSYGIRNVKWRTMHAVWYCVCIYIINLYLLQFVQFFLHTIPGYLMDFVLFLKGKKRRMVKMYSRINSINCVMSHFSIRHWEFKNDNTQELWKHLNNTDKKIFPFSIKDIDWEKYFMESYWKGIRIYILKDPLETLPRALEKYKKLKYLHFTVVYTSYIACAIILLKISLIFV